MREKEYTIAGGSLHYTIEKEEAVITGFSGLAGEVQVPQTLEGLPVTSIGKKAFLSKKFLRRLRLPDTVGEIGDWAFAYCDGLEEISLPCGDIRFGKSVFLECGRLKALDIRGKDAVAAALLAAVAGTQAGYLLNVREAGSREWLEAWDARMLAVLQSKDDEGFSRQVLCGEEDYGSTDVTAYMSRRRREKVRLLLLRLLYPVQLNERLRQTLTDYLLNHTKGCEGDETWRVVLEEHGEDSAYYRLFAELGCLNRDNLDKILSDIGENYPEMKAFFLRYQEEALEQRDFFEELEL